jgi:hypothetical protein
MGSELVDLVSKILGIDNAQAEAGVFFVGIVLSLWLLRIVGNLVQIVLNDRRRDDVQDGLSKDLISLVHRSYQGFENLQKSYEQNTQIIERVTGVLTEVRDVLDKLSGDVKVLVGDVEQHHTIEVAYEDIKENLLKTSETKVIIRDADEQLAAEFTITPEEGALVIRFSSLL